MLGSLNILVGREGFEPSTYGLRVQLTPNFMVSMLKILKRFTPAHSALSPPPNLPPNLCFGNSPWCCPSAIQINELPQCFAELAPSAALLAPSSNPAGSELQLKVSPMELRSWLARANDTCTAVRKHYANWQPYFANCNYSRHMPTSLDTLEAQLREFTAHLPFPCHLHPRR